MYVSHLGIDRKVSTSIFSQVHYTRCIVMIKTNTKGYVQYMQQKYKMMFRKKKCIVQHYHQLRVATNSFHIVLYCCTSFIISYMRKTCCFLDALSKTLFKQKLLLCHRVKKSLIGPSYLIGYQLLGFPGFQEMGIIASLSLPRFGKEGLDWVAIAHQIGNKHKSIQDFFGCYAVPKSPNHWQDEEKGKMGIRTLPTFYKVYFSFFWVHRKYFRQS